MEVIKDLTDSIMDAWGKQIEMSDFREMARTQQLYDAMNTAGRMQQEWNQHQEHMQKLDEIDHDIRMSSCGCGYGCGWSHEDPEPSFIMALIVVASIVGFCILNALI